MKSIFKGRLNRKQFFFGHFLIVLPSVLFILLFLLGSVFISVFFGDVAQNGSTMPNNCVIDGIPTLACLENIPSLLAIILLLLTIIITPVISMSVYIKRLRDLNHPAWVLFAAIFATFLLFLVHPLISILGALLFYIYLQVKPGAHHEKR